MNFAKYSIAALAVSMALVGCSSSSKTSSGPDCLHQPKLTKSCLEGTWTLAVSDTGILNKYIRSNASISGASLPFGVEDGSFTMTMNFIVKSGNVNLPTAVDSVIVDQVDANNPASTGTSYGHFFLSPDSTKLTIQLTKGLSVDSTITAKVVADTLGTVLDLGARAQPLFVAPIDLVKVAEIFYRAGNATKK